MPNREKIHVDVLMQKRFNSMANAIETVSPEGTFCDTVQIPSCVGDMELI